jgi:hypothetical protein
MNVINTILAALASAAFLMPLTSCNLGTSLKTDAETPEVTFSVTDSLQLTCYDGDGNSFSTNPSSGEDYYGQEANYTINSTSYTDNEDGTVTDNRSYVARRSS